jgi:uncharacterized protein YutD
MKKVIKGKSTIIDRYSQPMGDLPKNRVIQASFREREKIKISRIIENLCLYFYKFRNEGCSYRTHFGFNN